MMALEGPFLAALVARLGEPKFNLAAFGVAFAVALLIESPVIMMLSASTALVDDIGAFRKLRNFTYGLSAALTAFMLLLLLTPAWRHVAGELIDLPPQVVDLTQGALLIMLPWPAAIGYRRFYQGLLIRGHLTRRVAYGTVVRLTTMAGTALTLFVLGKLPGAYLGALALSAGVLAEALASRWMTERVIRSLRAVGRTGEQSLTYRRIARFYFPLALTSVLSFVVHPLVTFFMGHARHALESLAVLPVVNGLLFVFRTAGLSYQEVAIALLAGGRETLHQVGRFAWRLALLSTLCLGAIAFTPLSELWFHEVSGLSHELVGYAILPLRILTPVPALAVLLSVQRAILVDGRLTFPITLGTLVEVGGIVISLALAIHGGQLVGVTAAAIALLAGRLAGSVSLVPACLRIRQRRGASGWRDLRTLGEPR
jgi:hypothetical protein